MRLLLLLVGVFLSLPVLGLSPAAEEFMKITDELDAVQCEKRQLRRAIALAEAERRGDDERALRERFAALNRDPRTTRLEKRLGELGRRIWDGKGGSHDPDDLRAINRQRVEAFYRCG